MERPSRRSSASATRPAGPLGSERPGAARPAPPPGHRLATTLVAVELDGVTVRVLDVDRGAATTAAHANARRLEPRADLPPFRPRQMEPEVIEASLVGVDLPARGDEVEKIVPPPRRLQEEHDLVGQVDLEPEQ